MPKIKITGVPAGEAPEWVRQKWVGVEIPIVTDAPGVVMGARGGKPDPRNQDGYTVKAADAMAALRANGRNTAAEWWEENLLLQLGGQLRFGKQFCKYIP